MADQGQRSVDAGVVYSLLVVEVVFCGPQELHMTIVLRHTPLLLAATAGQTFMSLNTSCFDRSGVYFRRNRSKSAISYGVIPGFRSLYSD